MPAATLFSRSLQASYLANFAMKVNRERFTSRGRYLLALALVVGLVGRDTSRTFVYVLFAMAAGPFLVAALWMFRRPPRVALRAEPPERLTAGRAVPFRIDVRSAGARRRAALVAGWGWGGVSSTGLRFEPREAFLECAPGKDGEVSLAIQAQARGRHRLPPLGVGRTDPLGLLSTRRIWQPGRVILAYPRFFHLEELPLPVGRRYQPGGIPLASNIGDSTEFVGTREYREGDPLRRIHWRSWARRGKPVVKEYGEEYFSRVALVLDTFLPRRPRSAELRGFEAAISVLASIADYMGRSEDVVDIFLAGLTPHEISVGRSLGTLDTVLQALACVEPCYEPPFEAVAPAIVERFARLTTVVAVVLDWDERREAFLRGVRSLGVALRIFVVREKPTRRRFEGLTDELGPITVMTPAEVESRIAATEAAS